MTASGRNLKVVKSASSASPQRLRELITWAMDLERRTMNLYCRFEVMFPKPAAVRTFWLDMAEHESRHVGALALVVGLLDQTADRALTVPMVTRAHVRRLEAMLRRAEEETAAGISLTRAFEIALEIEGSEIEDLVLDLMTALKGEKQRERGVQMVIHDLGDLSYMIEKYGGSRALLEKADSVVEHQLARLRGGPLGVAKAAKGGAARHPRRRARRAD